MVGRSDKLKMKSGITLEKAKKVDLSRLLNNPYTEGKNCFDPSKAYDFELEKTIDERILLKEFKTALAKKQKKRIEINVSNTDRTLGTVFGSEITKKYFDTLPDDTFTVKCIGSGGQSFGAFIPKGLTLELEGDSNDYFGKGLSGGKLIAYPPKGSIFKPDENIIIGNVALYGATGGEAYIKGVAGERFCVRNSGAKAVVEGIGEHGCEYMTGGVVLVLGTTGKNFAAGMSGGIAYVLDESRDFYKKVNKELVSLDAVVNKQDVFTIKEMLEAHYKYTGSEKARTVLDSFEEYIPKFKKIMPYDYERMLKCIVMMEEKGLSSEEAQIEAFYLNRK